MPTHSTKKRVEQSPDRYFDRELSWLAFNERVLQEAAETGTPVLERLKFLAIFSSNLDEFFRVRVASLRSLLRLRRKKLTTLAFDPKSLLLEIHDVVNRQQRRFGHIFQNEILPQLLEGGIHLHVADDVPADADYFLRSYFAEELSQHINPVVLQPDAEPPFLKNGGLYLVVPLCPRNQSSPLTPIDSIYGIVDVPSEHTGRFVQVAREPGLRHVMFIDDIIRYNLAEIFPFHDSAQAYAIKLTRDADLYIDDEFSGDLVAIIRKSLEKRDRGAPTRLLFDQRIPYAIVMTLARQMELEAEDLVVGGYYHNFSDFYRFPDFGRGSLKYPRLRQQRHPILSAAPSIAAVVRERDQILHLPYHSFNPVVEFLRQCAESIDVRRISISLYRVADESAVVAELLRAARNGKQVRAFVEVKARFDERPNLDWAKKMERSGVEVLYSMPGIKVHTKLLFVESGSGDIAFLSTGNFNEKTARVYSDHGMFTADLRITTEVARVFEMLERPDVVPDFSYLLVAPYTMRSEFERLVRDEIEAARNDLRAEMTLKMNSLEDDGMIDLLYEASQAGVHVRLLVRGICCLRAGVPGLSDHIRVTSIVDRYLEHARVYRFHAGGADRIYLASADWMSRNLNRRMEVAWPIFDDAIRQQLIEILDLQTNDSVKAREIDRLQTNAMATSSGTGLRSQIAIHELTTQRRKHAAEQSPAYSENK